MNRGPAYPTVALLTNSCARGKATPDKFAVGNLLVHAVPLWTTGNRLDGLRAA